MTSWSDQNLSQQAKIALCAILACSSVHPVRPSAHVSHASVPCHMTRSSAPPVCLPARLTNGAFLMTKLVAMATSMKNVHITSWKMIRMCSLGKALLRNYVVVDRKKTAVSTGILCNLICHHPPSFCNVSTQMIVRKMRSVPSFIFCLIF